VKGDLTEPSYWFEQHERERGVDPLSQEAPEWFGAIYPFLKEFEGGTFLELGCSPGLASAIICREILFDPTGIDFSPSADLYLKNMKGVGYPNARLIRADIRQYVFRKKYEVVASFGLIEHFEESAAILAKHYSLVQANGLLIIVIPNFRYLQKLYHFIFDYHDLIRHNTRLMNKDFFMDFSRRHDLKIEFLDHVGKITFWGVDRTGSKTQVMIRRVLGRIVREFASKILARFLPRSSPYYSPWIVFVARKQDSG
jgi:cyclopropane fatty-acyl-phospholipid synthase-like methyltransferase